MDNIRLLYVDLFCGAGGTSTGVEMASLNNSKCAKVIACVNHDKNAIASHLANHPDALHFTEDIRTLDLTGLAAHVRKQRKMHPDAKVVLWASLECTNFSKAKGGLPRDADSRTLAEHLFRYIDELKPEYIQIENVEEFMSWGDLDENGKPVSKDAGRLYMLWVNKVCRRGYSFDYRILNAANYGAYTSRKRFFGIFAQKGLPVAFPEATHEKTPKDGIFGTLEPWKAVKDVLDLEKEGKSIFDRKKPLVDATLKRIYAGLVKFVAGGKDAFLMKWNSMKRNGIYHAPSIDEPCPVVTTQNRLGVAKAMFLSKQFSGDPAGKNISLEGPAGAITCRDHHALIMTYYSNGGCQDIMRPAPTLTTKDKLAFVDMQYGHGTPASIDVPCMTITQNPKQKIIQCHQPKVPERRFLMNPQFGCEGASINKPCFTLIAKMDKKPPYLIDTASSGTLPSFIRTDGDRMIYEIYPEDSETIVKIKEFMAMYGIVDITMRMLDETELKMIMGFPRDYILVGTQAERKKYIGNAVVTIIPKVWAETLAQKLMSA
ncbi:MAG: DNA cytosine methyltransferase [Bacteroidales bacterium]|nr:DNA cytosine methyltransferase [Bacteroidales bacterium]